MWLSFERVVAQGWAGEIHENNLEQNVREEISFRKIFEKLNFREIRENKYQQNIYKIVFLQDSILMDSPYSN